MIVINLFGGPGCGKSTIAAGLFSKLKKKGYECELVTEFAKDKVWDESLSVLSDQIYVFGKQQHKLYRLEGKVDIAITDSPLLFSILYDKSKSPELKALVSRVFGSYTNINFFIDRNVEYREVGRYQDESGAKEVDKECLDLLKELGVDFVTVKSTDAEDTILENLLKNII